jgi:biopolymer transport protein ExbB
LTVLLSCGAVAQAQDADERAQAALESDTVDAGSGDSEQASADGYSATVHTINYLDLLISGGWLMVPIGLFSIVVVAIGIERAIALRSKRVLPDELVAALGRYAENEGTFDPQRVYRLCQEYPSSAANVIRAMLLKLGRPHSEVEQAVHDAADREAGRLYSKVRTLNLAAAVTPLIGLLGTVWGMILAFFVTAHMPVGANRAEMLAEGIYIALVTTFGGLVVAIPAAILAHYFEGRIEKLLHRIEEMLSSLLPQVEHYEGTDRVRSSEFAINR